MLRRGQPLQPARGAAQFALAHGLHRALHRANYGCGLNHLLPARKYLDLRLHQPLGTCGLLRAVGLVGLGNLLQVVDVVQKKVVDPVHLRVHVARHGDVDEKHGATASALQKPLAVLPPEDKLVGPG